jgi:outer membrane protein OmpA-like peptidoglycan-associated protein
MTPFAPLLRALSTCAIPRIATGLSLVFLMAGQSFALSLDFNGPVTATASGPATLASYGLPIGPWQAGVTPKRLVEGSTQTAAWRLETPGLTSLEILIPLRNQLREAGYSVLFECETNGCGGFDFRYDAEVLPEPEMHVDLGDFRFLSAERVGPNGPDVIGLIISRSASAGFVQMTHVSAPQDQILALQSGKPDLVIASTTADAPALGIPNAAVTLSTATNPLQQTTISPLTDGLVIGGAVVLEGLQFATGAADLTEGRYDSLAALADWLQTNPDKTIALVGHTDASGSLDANIAISRRRAASVRVRLIEAYGIPASQIEAQGVGYLSPRDTNLTEEGRTNNRRVEAILTSTR